MWLKCKLTPVHYHPKELEKGMMFIRNVFFGNYSYNELYVLNRIPHISLEEYIEEYGFPVKLSIVYEGNGNEELITLVNNDEIGWWDEGENSDEYYDVTLKELNSILQNYEGKINLLMEDVEELKLIPDIFEGKCIISFPEQEHFITDEIYNKHEENFEKFLNQEQGELF